MPWQTAIWTAEAKARVAELWAQGYTASQIGAVFGVSRNSIIGLCHRQGYTCPPRRTKPTSPPPPLRKRRPLPREVRPMDTRIPPAPPLPAPEPLPIGTLTIMDLLDHHCRWPTGEPPYHYCGATARTGSSYCPDHHKEAHHS